MYQAKSGVKNFSPYLGGGGGGPSVKFFFFQSEHVSSQIWCQKFFYLLGGGKGGGVPTRKVAQNELKHILVLEFLRSDDFRGGGGVPL